MPIYEFQCTKCQNIDERLYVGFDNNLSVENIEPCTKCGGKAKKIISAGAIHTDTPTWLDQSVRDAVQGDNEQPIQNRKDLAHVMKEKRIEPIERKINPHGTF